MNGQGERPVPKQIGKYEIVGVLGQGGMGVVYRGRDSRIGRDVAIKTLTEGFSGDSEMLKRFYREAGHTGNLRHPNIVTVYDFGDEDGLPYIVMEFLDGEPLDKLIQNRDALHVGTKLEIMGQVCSALAYAHRQGMIHRDVKPANVIVQRDGLVKLLDFGIARAGGHEAIDKSMTRTGMLVGTPAYIAPERLRGELFDGRSDIFAAGVVLYQVLTSTLPFDAEYPAILHQILNDAPPPLSKFLSDYPVQLDQVIARALAKDPMDRYPLADEMAADLNAISMQLRTRHVTELLSQARVAVDSQDFEQAQLQLNQVLRLDGQHTEAREMMASVDRHFNQRKVRQRVEQLKKAAQDAIASRNWDQAKTLCSEAAHLDGGDAEIAALLAQASQGKQAREQIQKLLREVETARHGGRFESAHELAGKALELDPQDSRIMAICKMLEQEVEEDRKRTRVRKVLESAQASLSASRLEDAARALAEAESISASDPELLRLKDELADAVRREERKRLVSSLEDKATVAIALEQTIALMEELKSALAQYPAEATLLRLKMELDPRLKEQENKRLVAEVTAACRQLAPAEALTRIHEALVKLPGNADLLKLEAGIAQRLTREQREKMLAEHMARARALLEDHMYLETVKVLELCEREGLSSPELNQLMNVARSAAAERISQDLVERSYLEAKKLMDEQNYEEVLRVLPAVLQRVDEPALRKLLDDARQKQLDLERRVEQIAAEAQRLCDLELFDAAISVIRCESDAVKKSKRVQTALDSCTAMLAAETQRLETIGAVYARLDRPEGATAIQKLSAGETSKRQPAAMADLEQRLEVRIRRIADGQIAKSIEAARQALAADDPVGAESLLENASAWQTGATQAMQAEWKKAEAEIAAARKVLRFRKSSRR